MSENQIVFSNVPDPWAMLPKLADRLGVKPLSSGQSGSVMIHLQDGTTFDVFELLAAFLNRMDAITSMSDR